MLKNNMRPIHPGEILREEYLNPLGLSANALSIQLRVPSPRCWSDWLCFCLGGVVYEPMS